MIGDVFKVGDEVRVRRYEDLEEEFEPDDEGLMCDGRIYFNNDMRYFCGKEFLVRVREDNSDYGGGYRYKLDGVRGWVFSPGMLEFVRPEPDLEGSDELDKFLEGWFDENLC